MGPDARLDAQRLRGDRLTVSSYAVVGHVEWVEFLRVPAMPATGEIVHATERWEGPGGGGAVAAAQLARLAGDVTFFTALGDDELGHRSRSTLEEAGIRVEAIHRGTPTRRGVVHIDPRGERTITVVGERMGPAGDEDLDWDALGSAAAVYFTAGDGEALRRARNAGVLVATSRVLDALAGGAVAIDALVGSSGDSSETYEEGSLDPAPHLVVRTEGDRGGSFSVRPGRWERYPAVSVEGLVSDLYGAGDSFAAGLTFGLGEGMDAPDALTLAARCGAEATVRKGPLNLAE
jgi:ribokinase